MHFLERIIEKLSARVDRQLNEAAKKKAFDSAQDALAAKDFKAALAGFEALAEKGHARAAALAGGMFLDGVRAKVDGAKALKYLKIGADAADLDAIGLLGMAYAAGMAGRIHTKATAQVSNSCSSEVWSLFCYAGLLCSEEQGLRHART